MPGLIDSASAILLSAERTLEASAQNVANLSTKGFKRYVSFSDALTGADARTTDTAAVKTLIDFAQGSLSETGNPLDFAISGPGLLQLREGERLVYSRGGSFVRNADGALADGAGRVLQQVGGGDLEIAGEALEILEDGTVLQDGVPAGRLALYEAADPSMITPLGGSIFTAEAVALDDATTAQVRQGFLEGSNVVMSDEMVAMMASVRRAESGARLVQYYDELIGQAITTFSRSGK